MAKKTNPKDGIYQFLTPEEADKVIMERIASTPKKGGTRKGVWTESELAIRDNVILEYICRQGLSRAECTRQISDRWQVNISTAGRYIKEAFDRLAQDNEEFKADAREKQIERLENLLQTLQEREMYDQAIKVLDQLSKINGLYTEKKEVSLNDGNIKFTFQE